MPVDWCYAPSGVTYMPLTFPQQYTIPYQIPAGGFMVVPPNTAFVPTPYLLINAGALLVVPADALVVI